MATLQLTNHDVAAAAEGTDEHPSLRTWLREDWAILFSHPGDFVRCELEIDRWLAVVQRAFAGCRVRPLALASQPPGKEAGWVTQVSGDSRMVLLEKPAGVDGRAGDLRLHALHDAIGALRQRRFVLVIDSALRVRRTFIYTGLSDVPSPLELLGWADATRTRHSRSTAHGELAPNHHPPHLTAPRHHKHRLAGPACGRRARELI
jgi:alkyl hydroperoxide reductase subunit AhpC